MVDLLQKRAEVESELRGLKESRALNLSRGRAVNNDRIVELEALLSGLIDAEAAQVQAEREKRRKEVAKARQQLIDEVRDLQPQFEDALRQSEIGFREGVGGLLRAGELADMLRERLNALLDERGRRDVPLGKPDREMRWSGRIAAILAGLAHPGNQFGNLTWHSTGIFAESDNWQAKESRLLKPSLKGIIDDNSDS